MIENKPSGLGYELGARLAACAERELSKRSDIPDRCATCAFRVGTKPNGSSQAVMDAFKCLAEHDVFDCHHHDRRGTVCSGFRALAEANPFPKVDMPWKFGQEYLDTDSSDVEPWQEYQRTAVFWFFKQFLNP